MRDWSEFNKFEAEYEGYLPSIGEGENMATQATTAVCKLVYKWFNDGDVYDNQMREGWCNDISDQANWLDQNANIGDILAAVWDLSTDYEDILYKLCSLVLRRSYLDELAKKEKCGTIYDCKGRFKWNEEDEDWY